jgi:hypothetical protein
MAAYKALSDASIRWSWQTKDEFIHNIRQKNCLARQGTSICLPERSNPKHWSPPGPDEKWCQNASTQKTSQIFAVAD